MASSVSHLLAPIHLGLDVHRDTISVGSSPQTSRPPRSTGFPTTSRRCAGSSPASVTPPAASLRRGRPHRVRARPAACPRGRRLPGDRAVADPHRPGGPGQDRYQGLPPAGQVAPRRRAGRHPHPTLAEEAVWDPCRARADVVTDRTRARHRLGKFLLRHAPRLARRSERLDPRARTLAARPAVRRTSPCRHLRALPGGPARPRRAAGRRRGRPCRLVRPATVRLAGRPAGRLPRRGPARRPHAGRRGRRLAPLPAGEHLHGLLRAGAKRAAPAASGPGADSCPRPATPTCARSWSSRPGPTSTAPRSAPRPPAASRAWTPPRRPCVGGAAAVVRPLCAGSPARKASKNLVVAAIARELAGFLWAEVTA